MVATVCIKSDSGCKILGKTVRLGGHLEIQDGCPKTHRKNGTNSNLVIWII